MMEYASRFGNDSVPVILISSTDRVRATNRRMVERGSRRDRKPVKMGEVIVE